MKKRLISICTLIIFIIVVLPLAFSKKAYAYTNNAYFSNLKIALTSMSSSSVKVTLNGQYTVNNRDYPSGTVFTMNVNGTNISFNGASCSQVTLVPKDSSNLLTISNGSYAYSYKGNFLMEISNNKILPIDTIGMEEYLKGVVGYEMSDYFPLEALKAQAVAARNFALSEIGANSSKGYDFDDTTYYQVYRGYNANYTNVIKAVDSTKGQILLYSDQLVQALYSASNGGYSEDSENVWGSYVPYLRAQPDSYDKQLWPCGNVNYTTSQIQTILKNKGYLTSTDTFLKLDLKSITFYKSGRVANINIVYKDSTGTMNTRSFTKDSARGFLGFPSGMYTVTYNSTTDTYTFSGKGNGHGLGMSQIGAKNRAAAGQTYDQILKFYYQNTSLQNIIQRASIGKISEDKSQLTVGQTINFSASATGGNGFGYLFKFVVKANGTVVLTKDYSSASTLAYSPKTEGNYTVDIYVKDSFSPADYDSKAQLSFMVNPPYTKLQMTKVTATSSFYIGRTISFNTTTAYGSGKGTTYRYDVYAGGKLLVSRNYDKANTYVYTPSSADTYTIKVYAKDAASIYYYDTMKQFNITVLAKTLYLAKLPLSKGITSSDVTALQGALKTLGYSVSDKAGYFGTYTKNAVIAFQKLKKLQADGIVGTATYNALNSALIDKKPVKTLSF